MKSIRSATAAGGLALCIAAAALTGCSGDSNNDNNTTPPPPPPPATTSFTTFVHDQLAATSETASPVDINDITFSFPDDDNPSAFDDVLGSSP